jgi:hypothetical protein
VPKRQNAGANRLLVSEAMEAEDLEAGQGPQERTQLMMVWRGCQRQLEQTEVPPAVRCRGVRTESA